ncbi:MAG: hypothetical protein KJ998_12140 [Gammaproteobacteria bacterium]|nr:hypothetical protein [Gammaproteobacteria bacterium]
MNIKDVRRLLKDWGKYWAAMERPVGFHGTSITAKVIEQAKTGIFASTDKNATRYNSASIRPPAWAGQIVQITEALPQAQRRALNMRYIKNTTLTNTEKLALINAELELVASL